MTLYLKNAAVKAGTFYICPIIKLNADTETEDETSALTIYLKRDTNVEPERRSTKRCTVISADKHYTVAISDQSKVVLADSGIKRGAAKGKHMQTRAII